MVVRSTCPQGSAEPDRDWARKVIVLFKVTRRIIPPTNSFANFDIVSMRRSLSGSDKRPVAWRNVKSDTERQGSLALYCDRFQDHG